MAQGDKAGAGGSSQATSQAFDQASKSNEIQAVRTTNIMVGDFVSELMQAMKFRMKVGQTQGDWVEEPERLFSDGGIFATEERIASKVKLQLTLSLDASTSMWMNKIMGYAGPTFIQMDRVIREAAMEVPEGCITYAPFIFHEKAMQIPASFLSMYSGGLDYTGVKLRRGQNTPKTVWPRSPRKDEFEAAMRLGQIPQNAMYRDYEMSGTETNISELFKAIQQWENVHGDPSALRLDIILTDGVFDNRKDVEMASRFQEFRRNSCRTKTIMLNFLERKEWGDFAVPEHSLMYPVTPDNLDSSIRGLLSEAVAELM